MLSLFPGGKSACRNADLLKGSGPFSNPFGLAVFTGGPVGGDAKANTGEKDWIHANSVAYDPVRDQVRSHDTERFARAICMSRSVACFICLRALIITLSWNCNR